MNTTKPNTVFWIITVIALLWNLMGIFQFLSSTFMLETIVESLPEEQANLYTNMPSWYTIIFGIATTTGLLGSITMLMRKKITVMLFLISLVGVLIIQLYWILGTEAMEVLGLSFTIMPILVIITSIVLYFYNKGAAQKGWLR